MSNDRVDLIDRLIQHEGASRYAYKDTLGNLTIGIGRNIQSGSKAGISMDEQLHLLKNDIDKCDKQLSQNLVYKTLDRVRQEVLIEMCFNLGYSGLMGFKKMLSCIAKGDWKNAVKEARDSLWAKQIGKARLDDLMKRLETGEY